MKKTILSIIFMNLFLNVLYSEDNIQSERIYIFKIIAFNSRYEIFCSKTPIGYYKYPQKINEKTVYLTYETNIFFDQCKFDESMVIFGDLYPSNIWSNSRGEVLRLKKRYSPVIEKNRKRKNYPFGFGKN